MAHVEASKLTAQELAELSCTYAALILHDDGQDITGDKIGKLVSAAGVKIEAYWPKLFAKALIGKDITSFFSFGGQAAGAPAPANNTPTPAPAEKKADDKAKKPEKKEVPPPPKEEEEDVGMGGLFD